MLFVLLCKLNATERVVPYARTKLLSCGKRVFFEPNLLVSASKEYSTEPVLGFANRNRARNSVLVT
jgi:hypothetical protein